MTAEKKFLLDYLDTIRKFVSSASRAEISDLYYTNIHDNGYTTVSVDDALDSIVDEIKSIEGARKRVKEEKITLNI